MNIGNSKLLRINFIFILLLLIFSTVDVSFSQHNIMPLGNSITRGMGGAEPYTGYRNDLYSLLINDGWNFDFVGSQSDGNPAIFDTDHEGHGGWRADSIDAHVSDWLNQYNPDIVLLHIGTNDISAQESNSSTIVEIESILNKIFNKNTSTAILLCKLIPQLDRDNYAYDQQVTDLNVLIEQLYNTKKNDEGFNIYLVDQNAAFKANSNWQQDYMIDNVHPTSDGYHVMATTFYNVLTTVTFPQYKLTVGVNPEGAGSVIVDPDKSLYSYYETVTLTAVPSGDFRFDHWSGDIDINSTNPRPIYMLKDRTIIANFVSDSYESVSVPDTPTGPTTGNGGEELSFSTGGAVSSMGHEVEYQFDWGDGNQSTWGAATRKHTYGSGGTYQVKARARCVTHTDIVSSWSNSHTVDITGDVSYVLTVWVNPEGAGTVLIDPDKAGYAQDEVVRLEAIPANETYSFAYWSGDIDTNYSNPVNIYMVKSRTIIANFTGGGGEGEIVSTPTMMDGPTVGSVGENLSFYTGGATSNLDHEIEYQFDWGDGNQSSWGASAQSYSYSSTGTFSVKARARCKTHTSVVSAWSTTHSITISTSTSSYSLTVLVNPVGAGTVQVTPDKDGYVQDESVNLNATANTNYTFSHWSGDISTNYNNPVNIYMVKSRTLIANFSSDVYETVSVPDTPSGATTGDAGVELTFSSGGAISNMGHNVEYQFDWGDGNQSGWGSASGTHIYNSVGVYDVRVRARCATHTDIVSIWSVPHSVDVSGESLFALTVLVSPDAAGTVTITPEKALYSNGEKVTLEAIPAPGNYYFKYWTGDIDTNQINPINIYMLKDRTIVANFGTYNNETVSAPDAPTGPTTGATGFNLTFITGGAVSSLGDDVEYQFDWGDGEQSTWGSATRSHAFTTEGTFQIRARARCTIHTDVVSGWSNSHYIVISQFSGYSLTINVSPPGAGKIGRDPYKVAYNSNEWVKLTPIPYQTDSNIRIEAESGTISGSMAVGTSTAASGDSYIYSTSNLPENGSVEFTFEITEAGDYFIWGRCYALSNNEDAFLVEVDGNAALLTWNLETSYYSWVWQKITDNNVAQQFTFGVGTHTVKILTQDLNARLDKIIISKDPYFQPVAKEEIREIRIEAEDGTISGPIAIGNDLQASGEQYIYGTTRDPQVGHVEYTFTVAEAGDYYIWGRCYALSGGEDSFFIQMDGSAQILTWHLNTEYYTWKWQKVSDNYVEQVFSLTAGTHTLKVIKRDINARLDKLVITKDPTFQPVGKEEGALENVYYRFDHWSGDLTGSNNPADVIMDRDKTITAYFIESDHFISTPTISGPNSGFIGENVSFTASGASSSLGHPLEYQFEWGDSDTSDWGSATRSHVYNSSNTWQLRTRARSIVDTTVVSDWSQIHTIVITGFTLTITVDPNGVGTVAKSPDKTEYAYGDTVSLTPTAIAGYSFSNWTGDLTGSDNPARLVMNSHKSVTAVFVESIETVSRPTFLTGPHSGIMGQTLSFSTGGATSNLGHEVEYQFNWGDGTISDWGASSLEHSYYIAGTMQVLSRARCKNHPSVVSNWSDPHSIVITGYSITIAIDPVGTGTIQKSPNSQKYALGTSVVLSAIATTGYRFNYWSGDLTGSQNPDTITVTGDKYITAHFVATQEIVSAPTMLVGPDTTYLDESVVFITGGSSSNLGNEVEYQFDWGDGTFSEWGDSLREHTYTSVGDLKVKARGRSKVNTSVVSNWTEAHNIVVKSIYFTISTSVDPIASGTINRTPFKSQYKEGEIVILSPLPSPGYVFDYWSGDLNGIDNPVYVIVSKSMNVIAHFRLITDVENEQTQIPDNFALKQNYPNPFNPETTISYQLPENCNVKITIYNVQGQVIKTLVNEFQPKGYYSVRWHADDDFGRKVSSGVYIYRMETDTYSQVKKMLLMQ